MAQKYEIKKTAWARLSEEKRNMKCWQNENLVKVILIVKSTEKILIYMTKQKSLKKIYKKITTHLDAGGCHAPSLFIFAKPAIQNTTIQPGVF